MCGAIRTKLGLLGPSFKGPRFVSWIRCIFGVESISIEALREERNCFHALGRWRQPLAVEEKFGMFQAHSTYTYLAKRKFIRLEKAWKAKEPSCPNLRNKGAKYGVNTFGIHNQRQLWNDLQNLSLGHCSAWFDILPMGISIPIHDSTTDWLIIDVLIINCIHKGSVRFDVSETAFVEYFQKSIYWHELFIDLELILTNVSL